jgi:hypothetical protein
MTSRRTFLKMIPTTLGVCALAPHVLAQPAPVRAEKSAPAVAALGYKKSPPRWTPKNTRNTKPAKPAPAAPFTRENPVPRTVRAGQQDR